MSVYLTVSMPGGSAMSLGLTRAIDTSGGFCACAISGGLCPPIASL
jgi:hypothetical protein